METQKLDHMYHADRRLKIVADHREEPSGIPGLLLQRGMDVQVVQLKTGDYVINEEIIIERKSADDFIQSLVSQRLFTQCSKLAKSILRPFLLLEGNPFQTAHQIDRQAVKGALLSVIASWQIPMIYSKNREDSVNILCMLGNHALKQSQWVRNNGYKSKRLKNQRLRFLQGLPNTGPVMADRLYTHFGSIAAIVNADVNELLLVEGIGKKTATRIRTFLSGDK